MLAPALCIVKFQIFTFLRELDGKTRIFLIKSNKFGDRFMILNMMGNLIFA